ncbi:hypothetical protein [Mycolicibacterium goodii]|uniref:hypothetical protein n=1 Tax=Mycolicibacterium goodii TaxID=134601 RepID=UPI0009F8DD34
MSENNAVARIDEVAPGDVIALGTGEPVCKVVHKEDTDSGVLLTFEGDDGVTFQRELPADTAVPRSLPDRACRRWSGCGVGDDGIVAGEVRGSRNDW